MKIRNKTTLEQWAYQIAKKRGFSIKKKIHKGYYYSKDHPRDLIYVGVYKDNSAVLKVYDDPRISYEPLAQKNFLKLNHSKLLKAPAVYDYQMVTCNKGWLIMELLPKNGKFFTSPLDSARRKEFLDVYIEYRKNYPKKPTRPLLMSEKLPADEFHIFRIGRWLEQATKVEANTRLTNTFFHLSIKDFIPLYIRSLQFMHKVFKDRPMQWSHGHFKPKEIYKTGNRYYLTDFDHEKMYPEGYEFGFIVWSDWLLTGDWKMPYKPWRQGIDNWINDFKSIARKLKINNYGLLMRGCLIERALGTLLADVAASGKSKAEQIQRTNNLLRLIKELIK